MSTVAAKIVAPLLRSIGPAVVVELLCGIDPKELAEKVKPHLEAAVARMPREWRRAFVLALRRLAEIAAACVPEVR